MVYTLSGARIDFTATARSTLVAGAVALALCVATPLVTRADDGYATWYGPGFQGNVMANGQIYNMYDPTTTACNIYPFGTWIKVTNPANGKSVVVQVRDRGAFHHAVDLSYAAFKLIGDPAAMEIPITYQVVAGPGGNVAPAPRAAPSSRGARPAPATQYVVQPGDTLSGIATQFALDQSTLATWNAVTDPNLLAPGQTLRLTAPPSAPAPAPTHTGTYVVQLGDSLLALAVQFGVSADSLAAANNLADPYPLVAGQSIILPNGVAAAAPPSYTVQPGDTLSGIASNYNVGIDALATANQISDPNTLQPGTVLTIPTH